MAIDIEAVRVQQRELNMALDEVAAVKRKLKRHQNLLDDGWRGTEIKGIDSEIEGVIRRLSRLEGALEDLGHDIMVVGKEIEIEEAVLAASGEESQRHADGGKAQRLEGRSWGL